MQQVGFVRLDGLVTVVDTDEFDPDDPQVGPLTRAQVRQADLLVLSKLDMVNAARADEVKSQIRGLNPHARLVETCPPALLLGLRDQDIKPGLTAPLLGHASASHFQTAHLRIEAPVSFRTFLPRLTALPTAVYRAKGWLNLKERAGDKILAHIVGRRIHVRTVGPWADEPSETPRTELVFIGAPDGWASDQLVADLSQAARGEAGDPVPDRLDVPREP